MLTARTLLPEHVIGSRSITVFFLTCLWNLPLGANTLLLLTGGAVISDTAGTTTDRRDNITDTSDPSLSRDASYSFSYTDPSLINSLLQGQFEAQGTVSYGTLGTTISANVQNGHVTYPAVDFFSSALWQDAVTFHSTSASGTAIFTYSLDGTGSGTTQTPEGVQSSELLRFYAGLIPSGSIPFTNYTVTNQSLHTTYTTVAIPFVSGVPLSVEATVGTNVSFTCSAPTNLAACSDWIASGVLNFGHTAVLDGIQLFDAQGSPISNFSIQSQSGTSYTANGVVPEPNCLVLLGVGFAAIAERSRRKQRK
jgi:hypothetical protein